MQTTIQLYALDQPQTLVAHTAWRVIKRFLFLLRLLTTLRVLIALLLLAPGAPPSAPFPSLLQTRHSCGKYPDSCHTKKSYEYVGSTVRTRQNCGQRDNTAVAVTPSAFRRQPTRTDGWSAVLFRRVFLRGLWPVWFASNTGGEAHGS